MNSASKKGVGEESKYLLVARIQETDFPKLIAWMLSDADVLVWFFLGGEGEV